MAADIDEGDVVLALDQAQHPGIADQRQILVIDGDGNRRLVVQADALFIGPGGRKRRSSGQQCDQAGGSEKIAAHHGNPLKFAVLVFHADAVCQHARSPGRNAHMP